MKLSSSNDAGHIFFNGKNYSLSDGNIYEGQSKIGHGARSIYATEDTLYVIMPDGNKMRYNGIPNHWSNA